jgi:hypothetical protein
MFPVPAVDPVPWAKVSWHEAPDPAGVLAGAPDGPERIDLIVNAGPGLVAVGRGAGTRENGMGATVVWTSADGAIWQRRALEVGVQVQNTAEAHLLAAGPKGIVLRRGLLHTGGTGSLAQP